MGSLLVSQVLPGGLVGKRNLQPRGFVTGQTSCTYRIKYPIAVSASGLRLQFPNWTTQAAGTGDTATGNTITLGAVYVEYGGTAYPVTFGGATSRDIPSGDLVTSDPVVGLSVSAGLTLYVRTYVTVASGQWPAMYGAVAYPDEVSRPGANLANGTGDLTGTGQSVANLYGPSQIFGTLTTGQPTYGVAFFGDSIVAGVNDSFSDESQIGYWQRAMYAANRPYSIVALPGESAAQVLAGQASKRQTIVGEHAQHFVNEYGINDLQGGATLAQLQARVLSIANVAANDPGVVKRYQQTLGPKSSSTDGWATTANQTTDGINGVRVQFNDWVRDGMPIDSSGAPLATGTTTATRAGAAGHPYTGYIELADLCESARNSGIWKPNYTPDGLHPGPNGNQQIAAALSPSALFADTSASSGGGGGGGTLPRDASSPAIRSSAYQGAAASQAWASNSFSPPAGSLIVVTAQATQSFNNAWNLPTITDSAGLTWTRLDTQADVSAGAASATITVFYAVTAAAQTGMTVTVTQSVGGSGQTITFSSVAVGVFTGFNTSSPIASLAKGISSSATLSVPVTPSASAGLFIGANNAGASSATTSAGTGEFLTDETHTGTSFAVAHYGTTNQPTTSSSAQTLDLVTGASSPRWQYIAWGVNAAAASATPVALSDSASGLDAASVSSTGAQTDTASAVDALSPRAATTTSDQASATEALAIAFSISLSDTASAVDSTAIAAGISANAWMNDTGTGVEALSTDRATSSADTAAATENLTPTATASLAETAGTSEQIATATTAASSDNATTSDTLTASVALARTDTAGAADTLTSAAFVGTSDWASALEQLSVSQTIALADTATGADQMTAQATLTTTDAASASDALSVSGSGNIALADTATAGEQMVVVVSLAVSETAVAVDATGAASTVAVADQAATVEQATVLGRPTLADLASSADVAQVDRGGQVTDTATGTDALQTGARLALADQASVDEAFSVIVRTTLADVGAWGTETLGHLEAGAAPGVLTDPRLRVELHEAALHVPPNLAQLAVAANRAGLDVQP